MTNRQSQLLAFLRERALEGDECPTFQEMIDHLGYATKSKSRISELLAALEADGMIQRRKNRARSIDVIGIGEYERGFRDGVASTKHQAAA